MSSPDLLLLVENCPKGAETLVTRCLHILTDKGTVCVGVFGFVSVIGKNLEVCKISLFSLQCLHLPSWWRG